MPELLYSHGNSKKFTDYKAGWKTDRFGRFEKKIKQKSLPVPEIDPRFSRRPARNLVSIFM